MNETENVEDNYNSLGTLEFCGPIIPLLIIH